MNASVLALCSTVEIEAKISEELLGFVFSDYFHN